MKWNLCRMFVLREPYKNIFIFFLTFENFIENVFMWSLQSLKTKSKNHEQKDYKTNRVSHQSKNHQNQSMVFRMIRINCATYKPLELFDHGAILVLPSLSNIGIFHPATYSLKSLEQHTHSSCLFFLRAISRSWNNLSTRNSKLFILPVTFILAYTWEG